MVFVILGFCLNQYSFFFSEVCLKSGGFFLFRTDWTRWDTLMREFSMRLKQRWIKGLMFLKSFIFLHNRRFKDQLLDVYFFFFWKHLIFEFDDFLTYWSQSLIFHIGSVRYCFSTNWAMRLLLLQSYHK